MCVAIKASTPMQDTAASRPLSSSADRIAAGTASLASSQDDVTPCNTGDTKEHNARMLSSTATAASALNPSEPGIS